MYNKPISKYPFTADSTMLLSNGLRIGAGVIISANLFPACGPVDYAQISFIGRDSITSSIGYIQISDPSGEYICDVGFTLDRKTYPLVGTATRMGEVCGVITATAELLPVLKSQYYPEPGAFILTPSAFMPRRTKEAVGGRLRSSDYEQITTLKFSENDFISKDGEVGLIGKEEKANDRIPVKVVKINGVEVPQSAGSVNLLSSPGSGVLIAVKNDELVVGGYRDLQSLY